MATNSRRLTNETHLLSSSEITDAKVTNGSGAATTFGRKVVVEARPGRVF